jgi:hypothetical protein
MARTRTWILFCGIALLRDLDHGGLDGLKNLEITRAATQDAGKRGANLIATCVRVLFQQGLRGNQNRGRAITALGGAEVCKGVLQGMKVAVEAETFDSEYSFRVALDAENQAGEDCLAVQEHGACAALTEFAAVFRAGVAEVFA